MYGTLDVLGKALPKFESTMTIIGVSEDAPLINAGATMVAEQASCNSGGRRHDAGHCCGSRRRLAAHALGVEPLRALRHE
jgi:hypothetical protein